MRMAARVAERPCAGWDKLTDAEKISFLIQERHRLRQDRNEWRQMYVDLLREVVDVQQEQPEPQTREDQQ